MAKVTGDKWIERIKAAQERDSLWLDTADAAEIAFAMDTKSHSAADIPQFNILHSNVATIVPAIYNSTPSPDVRERWRPEGEIDEERAEIRVAQVLERAITVQIDDSALDIEVEAATQDAYLAGRGVVRIKIDADERSRDLGDEVEEWVENERVVFEVWPWRDYVEGPARRWDQLPWVAFRHCVDSEIVADRYDKTGDVAEPEEESGDVEIWEIWDKSTRRVIFIRASDCKVLDTVDDPLGLQQFFPNARPIVPVGISRCRTPVCPFEIYRALADELDVVTRRIKAITKGLKVRGGIIGSAGDIQRLAEAGDNELVAIENIEGLAATGGIDKAITWWPINQAISVLQQLYINRDQIKAAIYEITGISDIVRGVSDPRETAAGQEIKSKWGSVRVRRMQVAVERHVRDLFVLTAEAIANNFTLTRLGEISGIEIDEDMSAILEGGLNQYRVNVESDSTIKSDLGRMKGEMGEFLSATASFFSTMAPIVQGSPGLARPVIDLYSSFARVHNLGKQAEDAIDQMARIARDSASNPPEDTQANEMKAKMQMEQADLQIKQQSAQVAARTAEAKAQAEMAKIEIERERIAADLVVRQQEIADAGKRADADAEIRARDLAIKEADLELRKIDRAIKSEELDFQRAKTAAEIAIESDQERAVALDK